jgi:hypothetical protein
VSWIDPATNSLRYRNDGRRGLEQRSKAASVGGIFILPWSFFGNGVPFALNSDADDELPAREMILDIIGDLFTHGGQLKHLVFDDRIVSLLGKLPILGCFVPEIVSPVHVVRSNQPGS